MKNKFNRWVFPILTCLSLVLALANPIKVGAVSGVLTSPSWVWTDGESYEYTTTDNGDGTSTVLYDFPYHCAGASYSSASDGSGVHNNVTLYDGFSFTQEYTESSTSGYTTIASVTIPVNSSANAYGSYYTNNLTVIMDTQYSSFTEIIKNGVAVKFDGQVYVVSAFLYGSFYIWGNTDLLWGESDTSDMNLDCPFGFLYSPNGVLSVYCNSGNAHTVEFLSEGGSTTTSTPLFYQAEGYIYPMGMLNTTNQNKYFVQLSALGLSVGDTFDVQAELEGATLPVGSCVPTVVLFTCFYDSAGTYISSSYSVNSDICTGVYDYKMTLTVPENAHFILVYFYVPTFDTQEFEVATLGCTALTFSYDIETPDSGGDSGDSGTTNPTDPTESTDPTDPDDSGSSGSGGDSGSSGSGGSGSSGGSSSSGSSTEVTDRLDQITGSQEVISGKLDDIDTSINQGFDKINGKLDGIQESMGDLITGGSAGEDLIAGSDKLEDAGAGLGDDIGQIQDFEDQYFNQFEDNLDEIIAGADLTLLTVPLSFVRKYLNHIVSGIPSAYLVIFTCRRSWAFSSTSSAIQSERLGLTLPVIL